MGEHDSKGPPSKMRRLEALHVDVARYMESDGFLAWLSAMRKFRRYSPTNTLLIAHQCPHATHVAGYKAWQSLGRQVRKGEKSIRIFKPIIGKKGTPEEGKVVSFGTTGVFDISQTDGEDLPDLGWGVATTPMSEVVWDHMVLACNAAGITVEVREVAKPDNPDVRGYYVAATRQIVVGGGFPLAGQIMVLLHELGHAYDPELTTSDRPSKELVAEAAAWMVGTDLGIEAGVEVIPYLAAWSRGRGPDELLALGDRIKTTATAVEEMLVIDPIADVA